MIGKIIIIEDDTFLQDFYKLFFKKIGKEIILLENGDELVSEIENGNVNLVVMDINLRNTFLNGRKIDGVGLSRHIKINYSSLKIPILLVTAYSFASGKDKFLEDSLADDYLVKPIIDYNQLIDKINKLVFV